MRVLIRDGERVIELDTQGDALSPEYMVKTAREGWRAMGWPVPSERAIIANAAAGAGKRARGRLEPDESMTSAEPTIKPEERWWPDETSAPEDRRTFGQRVMDNAAHGIPIGLPEPGQSPCDVTAVIPTVPAAPDIDQTTELEFRPFGC